MPISAEISRIAQMVASGGQAIAELRKLEGVCNLRKQAMPGFGIAEAAALLGCSTNRIRLAEKTGQLPAPIFSSKGRRPRYSVAELLAMRKLWGITPSRQFLDTAAIIAVQNFKGQVGKSTLAAHLAHYLAIRGYYVLVVDCDAQASTTRTFGLDPNFQVTRDQTLYPYLSAAPSATDLFYAVQRTAWPNIDLIPSNLELFDVEYEHAAAGSDGMRLLSGRLRKLKLGLHDLARSYDVVLIDPPPSFGTISMAVLQAANALLVPFAATYADVCSTVQFFRILQQVSDQVAGTGNRIEYDFIRLICSQFEPANPENAKAIAVAEAAFGAELLPVSILKSPEIAEAGRRTMSAYELDNPVGTAKSHKQCLANLDEAIGQVEALIKRRWAKSGPT
jgi:chromosome partitioning protein